MNPPSVSQDALQYGHTATRVSPPAGRDSSLLFAQETKEADLQHTQHRSNSGGQLSFEMSPTSHSPQGRTDTTRSPPATTTGGETEVTHTPPTTTTGPHMDASCVDAPQESTPIVPNNPSVSHSRDAAVSGPDEAHATHRRIAKVQNRTFAVQTQLDYERTILKQTLASFSNVISKMRQFVEANSNSEPHSSSARSWTHLCTEFTNEQQSLDAQMQVVNNGEDELCKLQYELAQLEPKLIQILDRQVGATSNTGMATSESVPSDQQSTHLHPLAEQYFDKRGDFRLLQDRYSDHLAKLHTSGDREHSQFVRPDLDAGLHHPDYASYLAFWEAEDKAIRQDLVDASKELSRLWDECQDEGLDVGRLSTELSRTFEVTEQRPDAEHASHQSAEMPPFLPASMFPRFLKDFRLPERAAPMIEGFTRASKSRIERWIGQVPFGNPDHAGPAEAHFTPPASDIVVRATYSDPGIAPDDVAAPEDLVLVPAGGRPDPNYRPSFIRRILRRTFPRRRSTGSQSKRHQSWSWSSHRGSDPRVRTTPGRSQSMPEAS